MVDNRRIKRHDKEEQEKKEREQLRKKCKKEKVGQGTKKREENPINSNKRRKI